MSAPEGNAPSIAAPPPAAFAGPPNDEAVAAKAEHLHPLSVAMGIIALAPRLLFGAVPIFFAVQDQSALTVTLILGGFLAVLAISAFFIWLRWSRFTFSLNSNEIRINSGVISRNTRSIPYQRVQDVNIEQNLVARILGLAKVKLETGSGGGEDASLNAVKLSRADALRDTIKQRKAGGNVAGEAAAENAQAVTPISSEVDDDAAAETIFTMDSKRLLTLGLFSFSLAIFAFLFAIFQNLNFLIPDDALDADRVIEAISGTSVETEIGRLRGSAGVIGQVFFALSGVTALAFIGFITGLITVVLREYGFRLDHLGNAFRRRRGLLTLTDVAMPLHRVQAALITTGPIRRRFGWMALKFQSLASDGDEGSDHVVAPLARAHEACNIAGRAGIDLVLEDSAFNRVARSYWLVIVIPAMLLLPGGIIAISLLAGRSDLLLIMLILPLVPLFGWLRWKHHRYASTDRFLHVRHGFWKQGHIVLPLRKIQSVDVSQNIIERAFDTASVTIGVAGGSAVFPLTIHALASDTAYAMRGYLLEQMAGNKA